MAFCQTCVSDTTPNCWFCVTTCPLGKRTVWKFWRKSVAGNSRNVCCCDGGGGGGGRCGKLPPNGLNRELNWLKLFKNGWKNVPATNHETMNYILILLQHNRIVGVQNGPKGRGRLLGTRLSS